MSVLHAIRSALSTLRAAIHAASAVEMHRVPASRDLHELGIDKTAFRAIHL